jgi:aconitate hydratase 2/2-methylisocitrate dehydratase
MSLYTEYLQQIEQRKTEGLNPLPIDGADLTSEIISQIKDTSNEYREDSLKFFIYNTLPGTTTAAKVKAKFLKEIILSESVVKEITPTFAFELLSHMKGGPSIEVLIDLTLGSDTKIASEAAEVLKTQFFLYDADTARIKEAYSQGHELAKSVLESYSKAEFFTKLPEVDKEIKIVTYVAGTGDISTDLLSPGGEAHSRSDRELHGKCLITPKDKN